jgi:hypothetical protein
MAGDAHLRWALSAWLIILAALLMIAGCRPAVPTATQPGTAVVVFLDLPGTIDRVLTDLEGKKLIPQLSDVCVYVSGVSAKSAALAENIGRFWYAYFKRTGADLEPSRYAHVLLHWPPADSCRSTSTARAR